MRADEMMDSLILLVVLTVFLSVGLVGIINEKNTVAAYQAEYVSDKNTKKASVDAYIPYGNEEGTYSFEEVLMCFQIQSQYMPQPHKISIGYDTKDGNTEVVMEPVDVLSDFNARRDSYVTYAEEFATEILSVYTDDKKEDMRFKLYVDYGVDLEDSGKDDTSRDDSDTDDFYIFKYVPVSERGVQ